MTILAPTITLEQWAVVFAHLQEVRRQYVDIGGAGVFGLTMTLNPLVSRYAAGERTARLYREMANVE